MSEPFRDDGGNLLFIRVIFKLGGASVNKQRIGKGFAVEIYIVLVIHIEIEIGDLIALGGIGALVNIGGIVYLRDRICM